MNGAAEQVQGDTNEKISLPNIALPKGGGAIKGIGETFHADSFSGTGSYSIPIPIPQARGLGPQLSLGYSSGSGNDIFGLGFSLSLPTVSRRTDKGIPSYADSDIFVLTGEGELTPKLVDSDGQLVPEQSVKVADGVTYAVFSYLPRQQGKFSAIEHWVSASGTSWWRLLSRDNVTTRFGTGSASRVVDPDDSGRIFEWLIDQTTDCKGNKVLYEYKAENDQNIAPSVSAIHRDNSARKYIRCIRYGNYYPSLQPDAEKYAFEVVFDYGEYDLSNLEQANSSPYTPVRAWGMRPDPFSSYRSGFEIRTLRLCRNILVFHHFDTLGEAPCLTKATRLLYDESPLFCLATSVTQTGYRIQQDGSYASQSLPALALSYSRFAPPQTPAFKPLTIDGSSNIPAYMSGAGMVPVDLKGEGLSGLLFTDPAATLYCEPLGNGDYESPSPPLQYPAASGLDNAAVSLQSLDANGQLQLLVGRPPVSGYFEQNDDGTWSPFQSFVSTPTQLGNTVWQNVDLTGDGRADLVVMNAPDLAACFSEGKAGYGPAKSVALPERFPSASAYGETELVTFADMFGDGLMHRVRIRSGSVEVWPCLGYGRFGRQVFFGSAPIFAPDMTVSRIMLADVNGSGAQDLVIVYANRVDVFLNQSGNTFSTAAHSVFLPDNCDANDQIQFADILGQGTSALVFTKAGPSMCHWYYNFCGESEHPARAGNKPTADLKPYLLTRIENNLGQASEIYYASSTKFYLEDKQAGRQWPTRLPFPVHVVEELVTIDEISGARFVSTYRYHDGYYDPVEKEFRGFGFVEHWDAESYHDYRQSNASAAFASVPESQYVPPVYTKTWRSTGAYLQYRRTIEQYRAEFFQGDPDAYRFPESAFDSGIFKAQPETVRQAFAALAGTVMREELYALDGSDQQAYPFTVSESNVNVRLCQPQGNQAYAVFLVSPRESISYNYERNPHDPSVQQTFVLDIDLLCGQTTKSCTVHLPRRATAPSSEVYPEQVEVRASASHNSYINTDDSEEYRFRGVACEAQSFEVLGLESHGAPYFTFDDLLPLATAIDHPLPYQAEPIAGTLQARQLTWSKEFFWNADLSNFLRLGEIAEHGLPHHTEHAVFPDTFPGRILGKQISGETLQNCGGYFLDDENGYWWNKGVTNLYSNARTDFYVATGTQTSFVPESSPLFSKVSIEYDQPYRLFVVKAKQFIDESAGIANSVTSQIDYVSLQPYEHTDMNGSVSQALFDPLGQVIVTTVYGLEDGQPVGGMRLYPDEYKLQNDASFDAVLAHPEKYLQGATSYFYYNPFAWKDQKQPPCALSLIRTDFYHRGEQTTAFNGKTSINYSDGLGRALESKVRTDPGVAVLRQPASGTAFAPRELLTVAESSERWVVSGRTVYNNKGKACEQYLPYFSNTPLFESQQEITDQGLVPPPTVTHYDPLLREIRIDTPKQFFSKVVFTPWEEKHYDTNDTVVESAFYLGFMASYPPNPSQQQQDEKDALDKAAKFYNTPARTVLDNAGQTIRTIVNNLGATDPAVFENIVKGTPISAQALFEELVAQGYLFTSTTAPVGTWVSCKFQPYAPGFALTLSAPYQEFAEPVIALLKQSCLTSFHASDSQGREILSIDPRLFYAHQAGEGLYNFKYSYPMGSKTPVAIDSADAGVARHLGNIFGAQFWSLSPRGYCQLISYDRLQRRAAVRIKELHDGLPITSYDDFNLVERFAYGETQPEPERKNLRGQLYQLNDLSGVLINAQYSLQGRCLEASRQMAADYKTAINWNSEPLPVLAEDVYTTRFAYDAVNQLLTETAPDASVVSNSYNQIGLLDAVKVTYADRSETSIITRIEYDAAGRRTSVQHGNGIITDYAHDPLTQSLTGLSSTRQDDGRGRQIIQDMGYSYDPVGNVTRSRNSSLKTVFNNNQQIDPLSDYTYDALYRLVRANGRQHPGINASTFKNNAVDEAFKQALFSQLPDLNDADKLENYRETYRYDDAGNLINKIHAAASGSWSTQTDVVADSNRLAGLDYDASGNLRQLDINNAVKLSFNCCENLVRAAIIERPDELDDSDYYVYDSGGRRTRKVTERMASGGAVTLIDEKIVIGNFEITRSKTVSANGEKVLMERQTLRVMGTSACAAIVQYCQTGDQAGRRTVRFQLSDNLGSVAAEYDQEAQLISYEEYFPYGGTAIIAGSNQAEVKLKVIRYSGQECDDSTGLYYYGARYYAPWLGRWLKPDPAGTVDGFNLYAFVGGNPVTHVDAGGMALTAPLDLGAIPHNPLVVPHAAFGGAANAGDVHFGMNAFGAGTQNDVGYYGYRDAQVVAGAGITAETSWRHIFRPKRPAMTNATRAPGWIFKALGTGAAVAGGLGVQALKGLGTAAAIGGGIGGAILGVAAVAGAAMWWGARKARAAALSGPMNGGNTIGRQVNSFLGNEDFTNRRLVAADEGLYRHAIDAFSGDKNVVTLATENNVNETRLGIRYSKAALDYVFANPATASVHFHLDGLVRINAGAVDFSPSYKGSGATYGPNNDPVHDTVTAHELRYLARRFHRNADAGRANPQVAFYLGGAQQHGVVLPRHTVFGSRN